MLSNPFCFVLQVLAVLQEIRLSQRGCLPGIKQAELLRRYGPEPSPLADYGISSIKSPHTARWPLRPSSVTSHHVSILEATKGREPASHPSGPGSSTTGGMLSNPFCFVLQNVERTTSSTMDWVLTMQCTLYHNLKAAVLDPRPHSKGISSGGGYS
ncbi:hypothetical protein HPB51_022541 [Rhipicephalus microplus]|uniref:Secreted protein n=1 Tax=Rhipicephalus microplus TaxID=6941 RepID=A0A9J6E436_RHIMP|nr:hypothetical protein HPB51_022541 [Rhipicephalus microplus]